jgi:hypothetical protein
MAFKFPPLPERVPLFGKDGAATVLFARLWQTLGKQLESQEATQDSLIADLQQAQADIITALEQAGIALDLAGAIMPDIEPITILADYTGTVLDGQLPRNVAAQRFDGEVDVTDDASWSAQTLSGAITYTIGPSTGIVNITALGSSAVIEVTSEYNDVSRSRKLTVTKQLQEPPPSTGAGSESVYDSSIAATGSTAYGSANAGPLTLTCGASGNFTLTAPLYTLTGAATPGSYGCAGKWQYRAAGDPGWTDVDVETEGTDAGLGANGMLTPGGVTVNQSLTGLTPSTDYEFQLLLRNTDSSDVLYYYGTATVTTE